MRIVLIKPSWEYLSLLKTSSAFDIMDLRHLLIGRSQARIAYFQGLRGRQDGDAESICETTASNLLCELAIRSDS